jgi:hypothetical protein
MDRRQFLTSAGTAAVGVSLSKVERAIALVPQPTDWRTFEVTTRVEVLKPSGPTRIWLPTALLGETPFQKTLANDFKAEGGAARLVENQADALGIIAAVFPPDTKPVVTLSSRIATKNYTIDLSKPNNNAVDNCTVVEYFRRPT